MMTHGKTSSEALVQRTCFVLENQLDLPDWPVLPRGHGRIGPVLYAGVKAGRAVSLKIRGAPRSNTARHRGGVEWLHHA